MRLPYQKVRKQNKLRVKTQADLEPFDFRESGEFKAFKAEVISFIKQSGTAKWSDLRKAFENRETWIHEVVDSKPIDGKFQGGCTVFSVDADYKCVVYKTTPHYWNHGLEPKSKEVLPDWQEMGL
jgi:hypothetical protein